MSDRPPLHALGDFIRSQRHLAQLSLRQLGDLAKVSSAYLSQVERGMYTPSADVVKNIADALKLSAETLYERAGWLGENDDHEAGPGVEEAIRLDSDLTDEQKVTLLRVYRSFAASPA